MKKTKVSNYTGTGISQDGTIDPQQFQKFNQYMHQLDSDVHKLYLPSSPAVIADGTYTVGTNQIIIKNGNIAQIK